MNKQKVVLVTGASSGFGKATVKLLSERKYIVFGTSRKPSDAEKIRDVEMLSLDVCSDESVYACMDVVLKKQGRLDVLVNNAGYELAGAIEESTIEEAKAVFETNFFGVHRMVRAALPVMRRHGSGQIINISSLAGLASAPFMGIYSATKFAVEGYTEALRYEVKPFNIHVSLIETGFAKTNIARSRQFPSKPVSEYNPWRQRAFDSFTRYEEKGTRPRQIAESVLRIVECKAPRLRNKVGKEAISISFGRWLAPESMFEKVGRKYFNLCRLK